MIELNRMTAIEAKLDILMSKMNTQEMRSYSAKAIISSPITTFQPTILLH